ncbi:calcium-binding protein, partial [Pseudomonas sp. WHRI 8822A]|uniref:calcium-binding protein n=1 Tax=Pseudomonas sp. WHRI 8822A TaxID=3162568 RepID=UPI0032ED6D02
GKGNDTLYGSYNADTYVFNLGDGHDTIIEAGSYSDVTDVLRFGEGLAPESLWLQRDDNDLEILVIGSEDRVTISNWYMGGAHRVESFQAATGVTLTESRVQNLVDAMAAFGAPAGGEINLTQGQRDQLNVVIAANWQ